MDKFKQRLIRSLKAKCKRVNEELFEVESIFNDALPLFLEAVSVFCKKNNAKNPLEEKKEEIKDKPIEISNAKIKSLYREIAKKTHPDKLDSKENQLEIYQSAVEAKKTNKIDKIISIAKDLKIQTNDLKYSDISAIEKSIESTKEKITEIRNSYPFTWFFSNSKTREEIVERFTFNTWT